MKFTTCGEVVSEIEALPYVVEKSAAYTAKNSVPVADEALTVALQAYEAPGVKPLTSCERLAVAVPVCNVVGDVAEAPLPPTVQGDWVMSVGLPSTFDIYL